MIGPWSNWKPFPDASLGGHVEAPIGPGIYEVCHVATQEVVAFGHSANVAQSLSNVLPPPGVRVWLLFRAPRQRYQGHQLEYRTCAAGSVAEARISAAQLAGHRQAMWRRYAPLARG
ncbi:MAG: hypothetical protein FJX53_16675 [Alphaproteobacteria bacterium]|nr:hypothetical protein [Alphaproteobacteria bacterium]